jgi:electron transfer flavoprotein beta subunit
MSQGYQVIVCGSVVPDPLQTLEPADTPAGPGLKNEMMLPAWLDPWAGHALYEAAALAEAVPGTTVRLVALGPKAKLQQVMMTVAQKIPFELIAIDGSAGGFVDAAETAEVLADAIRGVATLDYDRLLVFGGWESASRGAGVTMQMVGERLGVTEQFQGVDRLEITPEGKLRILERIEGGRHQVSECDGPPALLGWATGSRPEPRNNPQVGMANMRVIMPALQQAAQAQVGADGVDWKSVSLPKTSRETRVEKDMPAAGIARELADWIKGE